MAQSNKVDAKKSKSAFGNALRRLKEFFPKVFANVNSETIRGKQDRCIRESNTFGTELYQVSDFKINLTFGC
jgi:hypothetical protein